MSACFVCGQTVNGDAAFVQHHVDQCLDASASNAASTSSQPQQRAPLQPTGRRIPYDPAANEDAALALALSESFDAEAVLALEQADLVEFVEFERVDPESENGAPPGCPLCEVSWEELGVPEDDEEAMQVHANVCLGGAAFQDGEEDEEEDGDPGRVIVPSAGAGREFVFGTGNKKDAVVGTPGVIQVLEALLNRSHNAGKISAARLCSTSSEHIRTQFKDWGWGCGYRNGQMIFASLRHMPAYRCLGGGKGGSLCPIPTITEFQAILEAAWSEGYDPAGAKHFKYKIRGSKRWIGTTEIYSALTWFGVRVRIVDFPKVPGSDGVHESLIRWITNYFNTPLDPCVPSSASTSSKKRLGSPTSPNAHEVLMASKGTPVKMTQKQPLYLQHDGHSRTVVGVDIGKNGEWLLIFDPSKAVSSPLKTAAEGYTSSTPASTSSDSNKRSKTSSASASSSKSTSTSAPLSSPASAYANVKLPASFLAAAPGHGQIWSGKGKLGSLVSSWVPGSGSGSGSSKGGGAAAVGVDLSAFGKHLEGYRVSLKALSKRQQYQILYVEEGSMLTPEEQAKRKLVKSLTITK